MVEEKTKRKASTMGEEKPMTKRARRKQPNEKNKWPQHPKIQSMDVRHKAYVRVAGVNANVKDKIDPKLDLMSPEVKFGRLLGGTDQRKRHAAVNKLQMYLKARCDINNENGGISEMDLMKLWKGLWFTLYMADKVPVQDELSKKLAGLIWCVAGTEEEDEYAGQAYMEMCEAEESSEGDEEDGDEEEGLEGDDSNEEEEGDEDGDGFGEDDITMEEIVNTMRAEGYEEESDEEDEDEEDEEEDPENDEMQYQEIDESEIPHCRGAHLASLFIRTFFRTIRREWGNMDKYRVDKFYTLTRLYIHEVYQYMAARHWNLGIIRLFNDAMFEEVLSRTPNGLRYHFIDIALEELAKVNAKAPMPLTEATFLDTLEPYFAMCQTGAGDDTVQERSIERIVERFLDEYSIISERALEEEEEENDSNAESIIFDQVHVGTIAQFIFELASDPETKDGCRKSLYDLHKKYVRRLKAVGKDVDISHKMAEDEMDDEVSQEEDEGMGNGIELFKENDEEDIEEDVAPKKSKSKRRKSSESVEDEVENDESPKKQKKSKKKKKKSNDDAAENEEEVVTISLSEQKAAKTEESKKKKKKQKKKAAEEEREKKGAESASDDSKGDKKVKFKKTNRSKSFKASMKALVTAEVPKTSVRTPEKSILLNKGKIRRAGMTKRAGRKRAVNYF